MMNEENMAFGLVQMWTTILKTAAVILPLVCTVIFIHAWRTWQRGTQLAWPSKSLMLASLIIFAATLLRTSASVQFTCAYANTQPWGATTLPLALANVGHACKLFSLGIVASAFCLALALGLPTANRDNKTPTSA
jgi:hypothetical protein